MSTKSDVIQRFQNIRARVAQAQADRCPYDATKTMYQASMAQICNADIGPIDDEAREGLELATLLPDDPPPPPPPAPQFVSPVPNGAVYGKTKWLPGSLGCDLFLKRGTPVVAPADCVIEEVIGGQGISGGAELILALPDRSWAWRYRHVQAVSGIRVGSQVRQGQTVATILDTSLDTLGAIPAWAQQQAGGPFPDGWEHCDLSVDRGGDQFAPTGGGGGNVSAYQWIAGLGYQGRVLERTPGPPDAGIGFDDAIRFMMPEEYR